MRTRAVVVSVVLASAHACARPAQVPTPPPQPVVTTPPPPATAAELVTRMHDRYAGKWYRTLSFVQNNTLFRSGGREDRSQWLEYAAIPGRLRIEHPPANSKSGVLFENGRVHVFVNGKRVQSQTRIPPILLMGADVYAIPPEVTLRRLDSLGVDVSRFRDDTMDGAPVFVIGGARGDSTSTQVWVDADRLVTVRIIEREARAERTLVSDTRFTKFVEMNGVPVVTEVLQLRDGRPVFKEEYADVKLDEPLPDALFDPAQWSTAKR